MYYSILIAARKPGSKVILCTDGLANKGWRILYLFITNLFIYNHFFILIGVGALDTDEDQAIYYNELATFAAEKG